MADVVVLVKMADLAVATSPTVLRTVGLGSCVGVCLYDRVNQVGGLAHVMLPEAPNDLPPSLIPKYAQTAIPAMVRQMGQLGASTSGLTAKLAGGAHMFKSLSSPSFSLQIGDRNVAMCEQVLQELGIVVIARDTGGSSGRTLEFCCETGQLLVKTVFHGERWI